jgi:hypothetical protein
LPVETYYNQFSVVDNGKMGWKRAKRAQASLEYILTYGWALLLIASVVGVMAFAMGGEINTNTCTTFLTMICKGIGADGDTLMLVLQNTTGQKITINPFLDIKFDDKEGYATVTYRGTVHRFADVDIESGDEFLVSAKGLVHADEVSITYLEGSTGFTRTRTSRINTNAPTTIELSNDGLDNDGDGFIDCGAAGVTDCGYVVEGRMPFGPMVIDNLGFTSIQFLGLEGFGGTAMTGPWIGTSSSALVFFVSSYVPGTTATVRDGAGNQTTIALKQGWNIAEIPVTVSFPSVVASGNIVDPQIVSNGPDFTISDNPLPKIALNLN